MNAEHVAMDELAEHQAGLTSPERSAEISAHLADCDVCSAKVALLDSVGRALADTGSEPMPADVATRLDSALVAERGQTATVLPIAAPKPPRQIKWAGFSAAAAVIALVVAVIAGHEFHHSPSSNGPSNGGEIAGAAANEPTVTSDELTKVEHGTGTEYNSANLVQAVSRQLLHPVAPLRATTTSGAVADTPDSVGTSAHKKAKTLDSKKATAANSPRFDSSAGGNLAAIPQALHALMQPKQLLSCIEELDGPTRTNVSPSSIDFSTYDKKPAAIILFTAGPTDEDAYVVGPVCGDLRRQTPQSPVKVITPDLITYQEIPTG